MVTDATKRVFTTDELRFEVPDGFVDRTMNVLGSADAKKPPVSLTVSREARTEEMLEAQVVKSLNELKERLGMKIVGRRERQAGAVECWEGRTQTIQNKIPIYSRMLFVPHYGRLITFNVTSQRSASELCDRIADRLAESLRLRKR